MAISRVLKQFGPLKSYFGSVDEKNPRFKRLQKCFEDPFLELHLLFYQSVLQVFITFNKWLQGDSPLIPCLDSQMNEFLTKLSRKLCRAKSLLEW